MIIKSCAKINIYLRIVRRRPDGYHEIETIFLPVSNLSDSIELTDSKDGNLSVTCSVPALSGPDNLCHKAATAFAKSAKMRPSWKIHLRKNIPVAAGLGGGSGDAAAVLKLLQKKYPQIISEAEIITIAAKIGADVPFFLNPVPALATGIGEKLKPLDVKCEIPLVIVFPKFPVSAKWAYENRIKAGTDSQSACLKSAVSAKPPYLNSISEIKSEDMISAMRDNDLKQIASLLRNDLAPALWKKFPILGILKTSLMENGALGVEISGSGSSLFAIAKSAESSEKMVKAMNKRFKNSIFCLASLTG